MRLGLALALVFACLLPSAAARGDAARWDLPPGGRATAVLAEGESHLFAVRLVAGTVYTAKLTGRRGFAPRLELLDEGRRPVDAGDALSTRGVRTRLLGWVASDTGLYLLRVTGDGPGGYTLVSRSRPSRGVRRESYVVTAPDEVLEVPFHADLGAMAVVKAVRARGSAVRPRLAGLLDPERNALELARLRERPRSATARARILSPGEHRVLVGASGGTTGELLVTVRVRSPRPPRVRHSIGAGAELPDFAFFAARIQPVFQARGCNGTSCHGAVAGQGRMKLRGPAEGLFPLDVTYWNYFQLSRWVELGNPQSRVVRKPLYISDGGIFHGGGDVFRESDPEHELFQRWIAGESLPSLPPVARAGDDIDGRVGEPATLDGGASFDPEGEPVSHRWSVVSRPAASTAEPDDDTAAAPTLTPDRSGVYLLELIVTDPAGVPSPPDIVALAASGGALEGVVTFEAEDGELSGSASVIDDVTASGGAYVVGGAAPGSVRWSFQIDAEGDYGMWGRVQAASNASDELGLVLDGEAVAAWELPVLGRWTLDPANDGMDRRAVQNGRAELARRGTADGLVLHADGAEGRALLLTGAHMTSGSVAATVRPDASVAGAIRNGHLVLDYLDASNFLFAGLDALAGRALVVSVSEGRTDIVADEPFAVAPDTAYALRAEVDEDGALRLFVDGVLAAAGRLDPEVRPVLGGLTGLLVERQIGAPGAGFFDDLTVTDGALGELWVDDFDGTPWTDPLVVHLTAGQHELEVLTTEPGARLDRLFIVPADVEPSDAVSGLRLVRRLYFDASNRSPTEDETLLAPFLGRTSIASELTRGYEYYQSWYESVLVRMGLQGRFAPRTSDDDFLTLAGIPARLANGETDEMAAYGDIARSNAWRRYNEDAKDFVYALFEEFLGREPHLQAPDGQFSGEYSSARGMYFDTQQALFGETGNGLDDLVEIVLGLAGREPDYNASLPTAEPGSGIPNPDELERVQLRLSWEQFVPGVPIDPVDLEDWTARYSADRAELPAILRDMLTSDAYADAANTLRAKSTRQFVRGLYMDVVGRAPDGETLDDLDYALRASADPGPVMGEVALQLVHSAEAAGATPPLPGLDVEEWLRQTFVRTLGRLPGAAELDALQALVEDDPEVDTKLALYAILTSQEYQYY